MNVNINYKWECDSAIQIPDEHLDDLKEDALSRILEMTIEGCRSGELHTTIRLGKDVVPQEDPDEGLTYSGWWTIA